MTLPVFQRFIDKWVHPDYRPHPVPTKEIEAVELRLATKFPQSFHRLLTEVGAPSAGLPLLDALVEQELGIPDLQEFFPPARIVQVTLQWRKIGLGENMVAFASTSTGNLYCFKVAPKKVPASEDAPVWYFDHDERAVESLHMKFLPWLAQYADIKSSKT